MRYVENVCEQLKMLQYLFPFKSQHVVVAFDAVCADSARMQWATWARNIVEQHPPVKGAMVCVAAC